MTMTILMMLIFLLTPPQLFRFQMQNHVLPRRSCRPWTVILHPLKRSLSNKTSEYNNAVLLPTLHFNVFLKTVFRRFVGSPRIVDFLVCQTMTTTRIDELLPGLQSALGKRIGKLHMTYSQQKFVRRRASPAMA